MKEALKTTVKKIYRQPEEYYDKEVSLSGWIRNNRNSKVLVLLN